MGSLRKLHLLLPGVTNKIIVVQFQINASLASFHAFPALFFFVWGQYNKSFQTALEELRTLRISRKANLTAHSLIVVLLVLTFAMAFLDPTFLEFGNYRKFAPLLVNSSYGFISKNEAVCFGIFVILRILNGWFQFSLYLTVIFVAALCLNLFLEFKHANFILSCLIQSKQIYQPDAFGKWKRNYEILANLTENLNQNISPYLCYEICICVYGILALMYNLPLTCSSDATHHLIYTPGITFPLIILMLSTVAVNLQVFIQSLSFMEVPEYDSVCPFSNDERVKFWFCNSN